MNFLTFRDKTFSFSFSLTVRFLLAIICHCGKIGLALRSLILFGTGNQDLFFQDFVVWYLWVSKELANNQEIFYMK